LIKLSEALAKGAFPGLVYLKVDNNENVELKAACLARDIQLENGITAYVAEEESEEESEEEESEEEEFEEMD
jgi:hypothetical protein